MSTRPCGARASRWPMVGLASPPDAAEALRASTGQGRTLDLGTSAQYVRGHVPGAHRVLRADLAGCAASGAGDGLARLPAADRFVLTCANGPLSRLAAADLAAATTTPVAVLDGGTAGWVAAGLPLQGGETALLSACIERYRRP